MPRQSRLDALATLHLGRVRGLLWQGLFNADTDRDDVAARLAVLTAALRGQPRLILPGAQSGATTAARWC